MMDEIKRPIKVRDDPYSAVSTYDYMNLDTIVEDSKEYVGKMGYRVIAALVARINYLEHCPQPWELDT